MRKITRFNLILCFLFFLSSSPPLLICLPLAPLFLSLTSFLSPLGDNYRRIYTPDSLLSCIIRLIPKFLSFFALAPFSIFFFSFPLIFLLLLHLFLFFSLLLLPFPLFLPFALPFPLLIPPFSFLPSLSLPCFSLFYDQVFPNNRNIFMST